MLKSTGVVLARNSIYNFLTQILVGLVAFVSIPIIVRGLGEEAFGILTLMWMLVGYFSLLDFGVGQASVKFLAYQLARGEVQEANSTVWVSVGVGGIMGVVLWLFVLFLVPSLVDRFVEIPPAFQSETYQAFSYIALAIPFVMVQGAFRAVPMAVQRFDLFNLMFGVMGLLQWGGSLILVLMGEGLFEIALLTAAIRILGAVAALWIARLLFPKLSLKGVSHVWQTAKKIISFGGWLTVSQLVSPIARFLDRAFVVSYQSLRMFTFYAVPYEALSRLQMIPQSLSSTLLPAMSEREGVRGRAESLPLYLRSINATILLMLPLGLTLVVFSETILRLWLGGDFPMLSNTVFKLLAVSAVVQAVCYVPLTALQAMGRPDLTTKYYLAEIPLYIGLCFALIPSLGIDGAGWAYLIRLVVNTIFFLWLAHRSFGSANVSFRPIAASLSVNLVLLLCLMLLAHFVQSIAEQVVGVCVAVAAYAFAVWFLCLDVTEKQVVRKLISIRP